MPNLRPFNKNYLEDQRNINDKNLNQYPSNFNG